MKKYVFGLLFGAMAVTTFTACSDDDDNYQWATVTGQQVYFSNQLASRIEIPMSGTEFTVPVSRVKTDDAVTVNLAHTDTTGFFTVPASVSFAAGEAQASIVIGYDNTKMVYDKFVPDTIRITSTDLTSEYGLTTYAFSAGALSPYQSIGKGTFIDNYYFNTTLSCEILQNQEQKNVFRILNPYRNGVVAANAGDEYIEITIQPEGTVYKDVTLTRGDLVTYPDFNTGYHHPNSDYDADINLLHPSRMTAYATEASWSFNRVLEWQENGLPGQMQLAPYYYMFGVGGWNASQSDGNIIVYFPGFAIRDFTVEMETLGVLTDLSGTPSAAINVTLGADISGAKAKVVSADDDPDLVAETFLNAEDTLIVDVQNGINFIPVPEGLTGKLQVVLGAIVDDELKDVLSSEFEYWGGGANPWEVKGSGDFLYTLIFANDDGPAKDPGLELQYNADDDIYRITHWGYDVDFSFKWDQTTNQVNVPSQFSGYTHSNYGQVFVQESDDYVTAHGAWDDDDDGSPDPNDGPSYYDPETQTFHFHLCYFVSAGYFGHGEETFTLSAAEARSLKLQMPAAKGSLKPMKHQWKKSLSLPVSLKLAD